MKLLGFNSTNGTLCEINADDAASSAYKFLDALNPAKVSKCFHALKNGLGVIYDSNTNKATSTLNVEKSSFPYNAIIAKYEDDTEQYGNITNVEFSELMDDLVIGTCGKEGVYINGYCS